MKSYDSGAEMVKNKLKFWMWGLGYFGNSFRMAGRQRVCEGSVRLSNVLGFAGAACGVNAVKQRTEAPMIISAILANRCRDLRSKVTFSTRNLVLLTFAAENLTMNFRNWPLIALSQRYIYINIIIYSSKVNISLLSCVSIQRQVVGISCWLLHLLSVHSSVLLIKTCKGSVFAWCATTIWLYICYIIIYMLYMLASSFVPVSKDFGLSSCTGFILEKMPHRNKAAQPCLPLPVYLSMCRCELHLPLGDQ